VVASNGGVRVNRDHLLDILPWPLEPSQSYVLAIGSDHPPNISGFMDLVAPALPLLRPHQRVVVAGRAAPAIVHALEAKGFARMAAGRLVSLGPVDEFCLDCVIANAHALLLPIQYGGGSNVKTAEALLSGRPTVATATAMRGFDGFRNVPGITLANDALDFGAALLAVLDSPFQDSGADHPALSELLWEATIAPLVELIREIEGEIRADRSRALSSSGAAQYTGHEA
jgi:glycosyltransferase involved in cell wall biosynthesis